MRGKKKNFGKNAWWLGKKKSGKGGRKLGCKKCSSGKNGSNLSNMDSTASTDMLSGQTV